MKYTEIELAGGIEEMEQKMEPLFLYLEGELKRIIQEARDESDFVDEHVFEIRRRFIQEVIDKGSKLLFRKMLFPVSESKALDGVPRNKIKEIIDEMQKESEGK